MVHQSACRGITKAKALYKSRCDLSFFDDLPRRQGFIGEEHLLEIRRRPLVDFKEFLPHVGFWILHPAGGEENPAFIGDQLNGFRKWHLFRQHHKRKNISTRVTTETMKELLIA